MQQTSNTVLQEINDSDNASSESLILFPVEIDHLHPVHTHMFFGNRIIYDSKLDFCKKMGEVKLFYDFLVNV